MSSFQACDRRRRDVATFPSRRLARAARVGGPVVPAEHPQRPQGVPPAGRAVGFLEPDVDRAGVVVLEQPTPVGSALGADAFDRFGQPRIPGAPTPGEVLRGLEQVVVPAWGGGEQGPLRVYHVTRA